MATLLASVVGAGPALADTPVPTGLVATAVGATEIDLTWDAPDPAADVSAFTVYRDGNQIATVDTPDTSYVDQDLAPATVYSYTIDAVSAAGEHSLPSDPAWATTPPIHLTTPIQHVVIVFQENQSFDSVLGGFCVAHPERGCDGASQGVLKDGSPIPLAPMPDLIPAVVHTVAQQRLALDGGKMDGFAAINGCKPVNTLAHSIPYGCFTQATSTEVANLWALAQTYALSDRTFEMATSPSWGGHLEIAAAGTNGFTGDNPAFKNPLKIPNLSAGPGWGCNSNKDAGWADPLTGVVSQQPSCIPNGAGLGPYRPTRAAYVPTIMDRLDAARLPWRIYAPGASAVWGICPSFAECQYGPQKANQVLNRTFATDAAAGRLPSFSVLIPGPVNSQHNSNSMTQGDNWIATNVSAVMNGPQWGSTAIFITYDDCGCFYDHVPPPGPQYGVREPMVIVSPFAKRGYTDHGVASFASMLAFTEHVFGLAPLGLVDRAAYDFKDSFDFTAPVRPATVRLVLHEVPRWERRWIRNHPLDLDDPT